MTGFNFPGGDCKNLFYQTVPRNWNLVPSGINVKRNFFIDSKFKARYIIGKPGETTDQPMLAERKKNRDAQWIQ